VPNPPAISAQVENSCCRVIWMVGLKERMLAHDWSPEERLLGVHMFYTKLAVLHRLADSDIIGEAF